MGHSFHFRISSHKHLFFKEFYNISKKKI